MPNLVFCLMGPTASGKTAVAAELIQCFPFEIISVDSAMVYRGMDIGTAKPAQAELVASPHFLIDIINPPEAYSAAQFCADAKQLITEIYNRGRFPLLVGGTMMYFNALQQGLAHLPQADEQLREQLLLKAQHLGWAALHAELEKIDPQTAAKIHAHDTQRIQRALEVYHLTGIPLSSLLVKQPQSIYQFVNLLLMPHDRKWLHQRIAQRFEGMLTQGFIDEVEQLIKQWNLTSESPAMRCVGYRQASTYLSGQIDYAQFLQSGIAATRQLAKRQLTWLRHWNPGYQVAVDDDAPLSEIMAIIAEILDNNH